MRDAGILLLGLMLGGLGGFYFATQQASVQMQPEAEASVSELLGQMGNLIGVWQSTTDATFTREFRDDGKVIDGYGGAPDESYWMLFTKDIPDQSFKGELEDGVLYLAIAKPDEEALYFKVTRLTASTLDLIYLDRGGTLSFTREAL